MVIFGYMTAVVLIFVCVCFVSFLLGLLRVWLICLLLSDVSYSLFELV